MEKEIIDLRSDTVTLPTEEMLEAIKHAKLGDDFFGEDQTVKELESLAAQKMGKEAALLVISGTQANLVSLLSNTKRGDGVILEAESHVFYYEAGGLSAIGGLIPITIKGNMGVLDPRDVESAIRPKSVLFPETTVVAIENTHNRAGGTITKPDQIRAISEVTKAHGIKLYMDGARIFNAAVALKTDVRNFTKYVDNMMFCLSKGLSCPLGSVVVGDHQFVEKARRVRQMVGGGMRQAGIIAAPGIIALEKMVNRLEEDHRNAKLLAEGLAKVDGIKVDMGIVQTNIVKFDVSDLGITSGAFVSMLSERGVLSLPFSERDIRMVTHRGIEKEHVKKALAIIEDLALEVRGKAK